jgi:D-3-phosphoglycerate dehydrogenase
MTHILVAGKLHPSGLALLEEAPGVTFDYVTDPDPTAYLAYLPAAEGLVLRTQPLTSAHLASAPRLRVVSRHGVGYDAVDAAALAARGIPLAIVGDVNSRTVAEHAMMLLLAASRRLVKSATALRAGDWTHRNAFEPSELAGKTLLIVGFGRIGRHLAGLAAAFGMTVRAHDPYLDASAFEGVEHAPDLAAALAGCDCVSIHVPKTDGALIGAAEIAAMKPGAVIVNTARGGVVDEAALAEAIASGQIGAAGLDVLSHEPPEADEPLLALDNVIVTPHSAGLTRECAERMATVSVRNVLDHFEGRLDPALVVNSPITEAAG